MSKRVNEGSEVSVSVEGTGCCGKGLSPGGSPGTPDLKNTEPVCQLTEPLASALFPRRMFKPGRFRPCPGMQLVSGTPGSVSVARWLGLVCGTHLPRDHDPMIC